MASRIAEIRDRIRDIIATSTETMDRTFTVSSVYEGEVELDTLTPADCTVFVRAGVEDAIEQAVPNVASRSERSTGLAVQVLVIGGLSEPGVEAVDEVLEVAELIDALLASDNFSSFEYRAGSFAHYVTGGVNPLADTSQISERGIVGFAVTAMYLYTIPR